MNTRARLFLIGLCVLGTAAHARDIANSKDHPIVSRYAGPEIVMYQAKTFDRYVLPLAKVDDDNDISFAAPGVDVWTAMPGKGAAPSYATPFLVAAFAARQAHPKLDWPAVHARLRHKARDLGASGRDPVFGGARH